MLRFFYGSAPIHIDVLLLGWAGLDGGLLFTVFSLHWIMFTHGSVVLGYLVGLGWG